MLLIHFCSLRLSLHNIDLFTTKENTDAISIIDSIYWHRQWRELWVVVGFDGIKQCGHFSIDSEYNFTNIPCSSLLE